MSAAVDVGRTVAAAAAEQGIFAPDLAGILGVSLKVAEGRLAGRTPFTINDLEAIADALGILASELVAGARDMSR
jgi:hypothetical protein